jgi:hypothetical protein
MSYKLENSFGTPCGGCCSIIASCFVAAYAVIHTYGIIFENKYEVINETNYAIHDWFSPALDHIDPYTAVPMI